MKRMFTYTVCLFCSLFVGQMFAAEKNLPTVAYRNGDSQKIEYTYDSYGHVTSEKIHIKINDVYELSQAVFLEYHQLPNGEFVKIKEEWFNYLAVYNDIIKPIYRMTSSYDSKGMELSCKYEDIGGVQDWREAILNSQGIRIGLKEFNEETRELEISSNCAFDSKGRATKYDGTTYTWGEDENELLSAYFDNTMNVTNIVPVKNLEYFNPYSLYPLGGGYDDYSNVASSLQFVWEDYRTHQMYADMDLAIGKMSGQYKCTITNDVWIKKVTLGDLIISDEVLTLLPNGGWKYVETDDAGDTGTTIREYDEHGLLTRYYDAGFWYNVDDEKEPYINEEIYAREYDAKGRLTKTTRTYNGELEYVETYTSWTGDGSGTDAPVAATSSVYPTVTTGVVYIENPENEPVGVYTMSDALLFNVYSQSIDLSDYPNGMYFIKVGNNAVKVIKK